LKFIILIKFTDSYESIIFLNLITQNIKKLYPKSTEIEIINLGKVIHNNLFITTNDYIKIIEQKKIHKNIIHIYNELKTTQEKCIINTIDSKIFTIFLKILIKQNTTNFRFIINKTRTVKHELYLSRIMDFINTLFIKNRKMIIRKPIICFETKNLEKTKKIINWNLESSGYNQIDNNKYIFIYLKSVSLILLKKELLNTIELINQKVNLKIIFTFSNIEYQEIEDHLLLNIDNIMKKNIIHDYFLSNDINYIINFCNYSKLIITNDRTLDTYNKLNKNPSVLIEETIQNERINNIIPWTSKKTRKKDSKFRDNINYIINKI